MNSGGICYASVSPAGAVCFLPRRFQRLLPFGAFGIGFELDVVDALGEGGEFASETSPPGLKREVSGILACCSRSLVR